MHESKPPAVLQQHHPTNFFRHFSLGYANSSIYQNTLPLMVVSYYYHNILTVQCVMGLPMLLVLYIFGYAACKEAPFQKQLQKIQGIFFEKRLCYLSTPNKSSRAHNKRANFRHMGPSIVVIYVENEYILLQLHSSSSTKPHILIANTQQAVIDVVCTSTLVDWI